MKKLLYIVIAGSLIFAGQSCTKKFEEINTNPNNPAAVNPTNVLAYVIQNTGATLFDVWGDMNEPETYGGHLGKIQYIDEARYVFRPVTVQNTWRYMYTNLENAQLVIGAAQKQGAVNMQAATMTFQAFLWQIATDTWRDIPFNEALRGDSGVLTPAYNTQEEIYPALLGRLKAAGDMFAQEATDPLGEGDLLYGGDVTKWRKFCNSLRLRVAIRISKVNPALAKSNIEEVLGDPAKYPVFESNDDNAFLIWTGSSPYIEPWASDAQGRDDHAVSAPLVNTLQSLNDPRLSVYARPAPGDGVFRGVPIGPVGNVNISNFSRIGTRFRYTNAGFTPFMRYSEVQFIIAEAAHNGWTTGSSAQAAYNAGVMASLEENGITGTAASTYLSSAAVAWNGDVTRLYTQKWISLFKNGHETWAETRRTDVPLLAAAVGSPYAGHNRAPFRYPYPQNETTLNGQNSAQYVGQIRDNFWGKQMYWDTRTGVQ
jgi:hypothetical protein